jgi:hypothetical protein
MSPSTNAGHKVHDVVIVGGGAAGIAAASSLLKRRRDLNVVIVEPQPKHYYQPGWTLVGASVFRADDTERDEAALIPRGACWLKGAAKGFAPESNEVILRKGIRNKKARFGASLCGCCCGRWSLCDRQGVWNWVSFALPECATATPLHFHPRNNPEAKVENTNICSDGGAGETDVPRDQTSRLRSIVN